MARLTSPLTLGGLPPWSMPNGLHTQLTTDALTMALEARRPAPGLVHHSDRGCQYTCEAYGRVLERGRCLQSVSGSETAATTRSRELLLKAQARPYVPPPLAQEGRCQTGPLRVRRSLLQSPAAPLTPGAAQSRSVRISSPSTHGSIINLSAKRREAQLPKFCVASGFLAILIVVENFVLASIVHLNQNSATWTKTHLHVVGCGAKPS